jgi:hypothetical protein
MGEHTTFRPPPSPTGNGHATPRKRRRHLSPLEEANQLSRDTIGHLRALMSTVEASINAGQVTPALARESSGIARALTALMAELRQQEKHHRQMIDRLTAEERTQLVIAFVREQTAESRVAFRRLLDELDQADQLLS